MLPYTYVSYFSAKDAIIRKEKRLEKRRLYDLQHKFQFINSCRIPQGSWLHTQFFEPFSYGS